MIRDSNFRKRSLRETMNMFRNVEEGAQKYIMPYKTRSDFDIDTFISYELSAYREQLLPELKKLTDIPELADITAVLEMTAPLDKTLVTPACVSGSDPYDTDTADGMRYTLFCREGKLCCRFSRERRCSQGAGGTGGIYRRS